MPVFARRRLQAMLNDLAPHFTAAKAADLLTRLEHRSTKDALAAEVELGLLWCIKQVADIEIEPVLDGSSSRPDAFSRNLFASAPALIEITALSDDIFSGKADMERAANIIGQFCDRVRKGTSTHLYYQFLETRRYVKGRYRRVRCVTGDFRLKPELEQSLRHWLEAPDWPNPEAIRLSDSQVDVVIQWKQRVHPEGRTFTTMPPVADDLEDNPVFKALRRKERQLSGTPAGVIRCIFLGDAGCDMLRDLRPLGSAQINGQQVIFHFLKRSSVDLVCVFSPHRSNVFFGYPRESLQWKLTLFPRGQSQPPAEYARLNQAVAGLPPPQLEGYQARSWHRQGMFDPQGLGVYEACTMSSKNDSMTMKLSARLVLDLLAGRITPEQFQYFSFGDGENLLDRQFKLGLTLQAARLEKGGLDKDDDHLVFDLEPDVAASPLTLPPTKP